MSAGRADHCFLFETAGGASGFAFCAQVRELQEARKLVAGVLARRFEDQGTRLAYLGHLDYSPMDAEAGGMLAAFERFDPVWLVLFQDAGAHVRTAHDDGGAGT